MHSSRGRFVSESRVPGKVALRYGTGLVEMTAEPGRFDVLAPESGEEPEMTDAELAGALDYPVGSPPLEDLVEPGDRVCVVVPDITRACGSARIARLLLERLTALGVRKDRIELLVGAGTHRAPTATEIDRIVGADVARRVAVHHHDAVDASSHARLGATSRETPVELNRRAVEADRTILVGGISFHYFAGFSGGRKALLPACASERSIQANHLLAFDRASLTRAAGVESGRLDGNPVSEDMEGAARIFGPAFLVNSVLNDEDRIAALYAGDLFAAHRKGCAEYMEAHSVAAPEKRAVVVVSCGGAPCDINMIQSHKALEHARFVLEDGGDLVLLAECPEGLGRPDFLDWFVPGGAAATARMLVDSYKLNGQTAWGIRWKAERYRVRLVSSLDPETVRRMGMIPHRSLDEALAASAGGPGWVIPSGLATLPILEPARRSRTSSPVRSMSPPKSVMP